MIDLSCEVKHKRGGASDESPWITAKSWNAALKATWQEIGHYFFIKFVQKHFTTAGAQEYKANTINAEGPVYQPRSGEGQSGKEFWSSYNGRKQKQLGQMLPLVFSGNTRDGAKRASITATNAGVKISLPGCNHLNMYKSFRKTRGPHAGDPPIDVGADLRAVSRAERAEIARIHGTIMEEKLLRGI